MNVKLDTPAMRGEVSVRELQSYLYRVIRQIEDAFGRVSADGGSSEPEVGYMIPEEAQAAIEQLRVDVDKLLATAQQLSIKAAALEKWAEGFEVSVGNSIQDINTRIDALESKNGG